MAQLLQPFNAQQFDPTQSAGQMPIGRHPVVIESSEVKATSNNNGGMVVFNLRITDGPNAGNSGPYRLNLYNQNAQAVEIAQRQLSALCHVTGVMLLDDTSKLHGIPFVVEVGLQKDKEAAEKGYTEVKRVFDMNGNEPGKQGNGAGQQQQSPQNNPVGGFGSNAPQGQGASWGQGQQNNAQGQGQQQPPQNGQQGAQWGQGGQQGQNQGGASWGNNQGQGQGQQQGQQQNGWQQNNNAAGNPPSWGR